MTLLPLLSNTMKRHFKEALLGAAAYGGGCLLVAGLVHSGISEYIDLYLYDAATALRPPKSASSERITIIGITESDLNYYRWPIDDSIICQAIRNSFEAGALTVGLDLYRDQGIGNQQQCLSELFKKHKNLIGIFNAAESIPPPPGAEDTQKAFNDLVVDSDGVVRRDLVHVAGQPADVVALPLRLLASSSLGNELLEQISDSDQAEQIGPWLDKHSGGYRNLDASGYQRLLPFFQAGSFKTLSLREAVETRLIDNNWLKNKIVLIGSVAPSLKDVFEIPQTRFRAQKSQLRMPGVEIHATRTAALLNDLKGQKWKLATTASYTDWVVNLIAIAGGIYLGESYRKIRLSVAATLVITTLLAASSLYLLVAQGLWLGVTTPLLTLPFMAGIGWLRRGAKSQFQRQQIQRLLGQATSPAVAQKLWEQRDYLLRDGQFQGQQQFATVLFADIVGFTPVSEQLAPAELLQWLNRGMTLLVKEVTRHNGIVNKFTGDGILAVFGAPISQGPPLDATNAIDAGLAIQAAINTLNQELTCDQLPNMRLRIGVHSGLVITGSTGTSERLEYAVMGDTVNCASRLESLNKMQQNNFCRILVSGSTRKLCTRQHLRWIDHGATSVKGRGKDIQVYELKS